MKKANYTVYLTGWLALILLLPASWALEADKDKAHEAVESIIDLSGLGDQLDQFPAILQAQLSQQAAPTQDPQAQRFFDEAFATAFNPAVMRNRIAAVMRQEYETGKFDAAKLMLNSALARKMTRLESAANTPEAQQELMVFAQNLANAPPAEQRVQLIQALLQASRSIEAITTIQFGFTMTLARGLNPLAPPDQRLTDTEISQQLNMMRPQMEAGAAQYAMVSALYTYQSVSDQELRDYQIMYESPEGQWLTTLLIRALSEAFEKTGHDLVQTLVEAKQEKPLSE